MAQTKAAKLNPKSEKNLADLYNLAPLDWDRVREQIESEWKLQGPGEEAAYHVHWLATAGRDGAPHVMPVGAAYSDGCFYVVAGAGTRKARDLAANPRCSIAFAGKGMHVVLEGEARQVKDETELQRIAELYADWGPTVRDGAFWHEYSAPSAGPPPWDVYEFTPKTVFGLAAGEPPGATRWQME
jgi:nitroimidazol reductase NimA-like FMN-containing flavoprotein (pyridoxamine 5'-phosphate oxidase superfamily)